MDYRDVDIAALAADHPYIRVGLEALEDNYRELQAERNPHLLSGGIVAQKPADQRSVVIKQAAARGAREVLVRQIAQETGASLSDADTALKGHMYRLWGWPHSPKGWGEWNQK